MTLDAEDRTWPPDASPSADATAAAISAALVPRVRRMVADAVAGVRASERRAARTRYDAVMVACKRVAEAVDALDQARFSGHREVDARRKLDRAAKRLRTVMHKDWGA